MPADQNGVLFWNRGALTPPKSAAGVVNDAYAGASVGRFRRLHRRVLFRRLVDVGAKPAPGSFRDAGPLFSLSVTTHGVLMAYVLTTFFIMGFGYFTAETSLERPLPGKPWAWLGFILGVAGTLMATAAILSGRATVLYTFYPPLTGSPFFYCGIVLVIAASWIWCGLMIIAMRQWKLANPDAPVPLAMFATDANAVMWLWTTIGVAAELLFIVIPASLGWTQTVDVGLTRTLFSWTLHPIGYFWLFPAYIAFYTMAPQAAGGRLYSDTMGRLSFALLLLYGLPVGMHHLFMDPEQSTGLKFVQMMLTILVTVPTLLTVFTISASMEIAGRLRGGRGLFGWILALPWERPMVLATGLSFRHALLWRRQRPRQHELRPKCSHPQYLVGDRAFPSDFRRRRRDHVFRHRL